MILNYFIIALRNIYKRKFISFINAVGLSISIAFCALIFLFIQDENSFDQFHTNKSEIYRIEELSYDQWSSSSEGTFEKSAYLQTPLIPTIKEEISQVTLGTRYNQNEECIVRMGDKIFEETITFVDSDFFRMFSFELLQGNIEKLFEQKFSVVITPRIARKFFSREDVLNEWLEVTINGVSKTYLITGVISANPANSSITYDLLMPQENRPYYESNMDRWSSFNSPGFIQLQAESSLEDLKTGLDAIEDKYFAESIQKWKSNSGLPDDLDPFSYEFSPITEIHLDTDVEWQQRSDPQYAYILTGIGILILLIACINYVSLSLSTSVSRQTEVGIRKAVGAFRNQLFAQFTLESIVLAVISMFIGLGLMAIALPYFNEFTDKEISLDLIRSLQVLGVGLVVSVIIGFVSGGYPALFLSSYRPALVLKAGKNSKLKARFTMPLVLIQFSLSALLIICSIIMFRQMQYVTSKDLGYDADQIVVIPTQMGFNTESDRLVEAFRQTVASDTEILDVAGTTMSFNRGWSRYGYMIDGEEKFAYVYGIDQQYLPLLNIEFVEGRNFDINNAADRNAVIVNEALVKDMGWTSPLDEYLNWQEDSIGMGDRVIGVLKDYHFLSLEEDIHPMFLSINTENVGHLTEIMVKLKAGNIPVGIDRLRAGWNRLVQDKPFSYSFLDDNVAEQYAAYERWMSIMSLATIFAIVISCLGLYGLSGINAMNRTKEIGIRKVMGAETWQIFVLLNRKFVWLAIGSFAIAAPLSWYFMNRWLDSFTFAIPISWDIFALSILIGLAVALGTVSYHAIRAANKNPADTLKYE